MMLNVSISAVHAIIVCYAECPLALEEYHSKLNTAMKKIMQRESCLGGHEYNITCTSILRESDYEDQIDKV